MKATITEKYKGMFSLEYSDGEKNCVVITDNIPFLLAIVKDKVNNLTINYNEKHKGTKGRGENGMCDVS